MAAAVRAKEEELARLQELQQSSAALVSFLEETSKRFEELDAGSRVVGEVLGNWGSAFAAAADAASSSHDRLVVVPTADADAGDATAAAAPAADGSA
mmetsp:Transcript_18036/g.63783  ORF Transcript_18036/g.63783 Transcript_18036/m.63783 type:complete len:97 (+) Transcript_18036:178-468(+)